jgi:signal transduction histidine kinase
MSSWPASDIALRPRLAAAGLSLEWSVEDLPRDPRLTPEVILQVMRIVQEALSNVIKRPDARRLGVAACYDADAEPIRLQIKDDGRGFNRPQPSGGDGLASMAARAERSGARLDIISASQAGTDLRLVTLSGDIASCAPSVSSPKWGESCARLTRGGHRESKRTC